MNAIRRNRTQSILLAILAVLFLMPVVSLGIQDWFITVLRGLSTGSVIFLAAAGLSLIFGLMDVLNLAHGTLFMIGAFVGWTAYARPDTLIDLATPFLLVLAGFVLQPVWRRLLGGADRQRTAFRVASWVGLLTGGLLLLAGLRAYPVNSWDVNNYNTSPPAFASQLELGGLTMPQQIRLDAVPGIVVMLMIFAGACAASAALSAITLTRSGTSQFTRIRAARPIALAAALFAAGFGLFLLAEPLKQALFDMSTTARFVLAIAVAVGSGVGLGALMERTVVRPLYERPLYQLMLTLGLGVIGREIVIAIWGRVGFTFAKPALFDGSGPGCPARSVSDWLTYNCGTILLFDTRVRVYNEIFLILVGAVVLVVVWLVLQRSRLGMVIRAGVQDRQMVEALGINVRRVFTLVFAAGIGLAALGGVLNAPSVGVSELMGESLLLSALIALAIGGLTSFPGAAAGSVLVGLLQQFMIKFGQVGIALPFMAEPFKPTPPLVPASTVLLMIVVLLVLPQGLFGRKES